MPEIKDKVAVEIKQPKEEVAMEESTNVREITGLFRTVSVVPTKAPRNIFEQIVLYKSGTTSRLYAYNTTDNEWVKLTNTTFSNSVESVKIEGDATITAGAGISLLQSGQDVTITNLNP